MAALSCGAIPLIYVSLETRQLTFESITTHTPALPSGRRFDYDYGRGKQPIGRLFIEGQG